MRASCLPLLVLLAVACASQPPQPAAGRSGVYGEVRLVPRTGAPAGGSGAYGDRRLRDVRLVDYSRPGFAVIYASAPPAGGQLELTVVQRARSAHIEPAHAVVGAGGELTVHNAADVAHVISAPELGFVRRLEPGERLSLRLGREADLRVYLLDAPGVESRVFVAPGPYAEADASGRYSLADLAPGPTRLRIWHPRFPPAERELELTAGALVRADFQLSAEQAGDGDATQ